MTELRELTDAELDFVGGGAVAPRPVGGGVIGLAEEIILDIFQFLEPKPVLAATSLK
jgi:hypothetical protein